MNAFANAVFTWILGWTRSLAQRVFTLLTTPSQSTLLDFLKDNWLKLTLLLMCVGVVTDVAVWMARWRPYYVWRTKWRRLKARLHGEKLLDTDREFERGYADAVLYPMQEDSPSTASTRDADEMYLEQELSQPVPDVSMFYDSPAPARRRRRSDAHRPRALSVRLTPQDDEMLDGLPPVVNKQEAFHSPVYPSDLPKTWPDEQKPMKIYESHDGYVDE